MPFFRFAQRKELSTDCQNDRPSVFFVSRWQVKVITASKGSVEKALTERGGPEETQKYSFAIQLFARNGAPEKNNS